MHKSSTFHLYIDNIISVHLRRYYRAVFHSNCGATRGQGTIPGFPQVHIGLFFFVAFKIRIVQMEPLETFLVTLSHLTASRRTQVSALNNSLHFNTDHSILLLRFCNNKIVSCCRLQRSHAVPFWI